MALAEQFVAEGYFDHALAIPAADAESREAWASLGFGRTLVCAVRDVAPTEKAPASVELHQAGAEDAEIIYALSEELTLYHARAPIFNPYIRESDAAAHDFQKNLLGEPAANAHWIAYDDGRAVGMNTFMQPFFLNAPTIPEKTIYLFQGIVTQDARFGGVGTAILSKGVEWAREQGYEHIAIGQGCELRQVDKIYSPAGTITYLRPPLEGFHRVKAAGEEAGVSLHILGGTADTHPHFFCDGDSKKLIDFPMAGIITHEPMIS